MISQLDAFIAIISFLRGIFISIGVHIIWYFETLPIKPSFRQVLEGFTAHFDMCVNHRYSQCYTRTPLEIGYTLKKIPSFSLRGNFRTIFPHLVRCSPCAIDWGSNVMFDNCHVPHFGSKFGMLKCAKYTSNVYTAVSIT